MGSDVSRLESFRADLAADEAHLRLLSTADLHMTIGPWDYLSDAPGGPPGLSGVADLVTRLRAEAGASLLLDCGDFLQGGPMADYYGLDRGLAPGETHPMIAAMNAAGYDAVTLGNHEFDYGLPFLDAALRMARFPVVATNIVRRRGAGPLEDQPRHALRLIRELRLTLPDGSLAPLRVGLLGLCPPQALAWAGGRPDEHLAARGVLEAAAAHAAALRSEGADLVVALVHGGIAEGAGRAGADSGALDLAQAGGLDVLLLGHAHDVFPATPPATEHRPWHDGRPLDAHAAGPVLSDGQMPLSGRAVDGRSGRLGGRPAVMPGANGSHLGVVDLVLARQPGGGWHQRRCTVRALPVPPPPAHSPILQAVARAHAATRRHAARPIGHTSVRLHSHFALLADCPALRLVAAAQRRWAEGALEGRPERDLPILSAVTPFRAGGPAGPRHFTDIPPGPLRLRHLHDLCAFPNAMCILRLSGTEVAAWLERSAGVYARLAPDRPDTPLLPPGAAAYNCDILDGLSYVLDLGRMPRHAPDGRRMACGGDGPGRVRGLAHAGQPVRPEDAFLLVTNDFRAAGGGRFPGAETAHLVLETRQTTRTALIEHVRAEAVVPASSGTSGWRLTAPPGSTTLFDTAPAAAEHLEAIAELDPEPLGLTPEGFLRLRLHF